MNEAMTKDIWDDKPLVGDHKYWSESQYEGDFNHTQFMIDRNLWLDRLKAYYRKPIAVLQNWERHFGEVTSDIKNGYDMKELKEKADKMEEHRDAKNDALSEIGHLEDKIVDIKEWWLIFNQCISPESVKMKLEKILGFNHE